MITIDILRKAGCADDLIVRILQLEQDERREKVREQNRIRQRNHRARNDVTRDDRDQRDMRDIPQEKERKVSPTPPLKKENSTPVPPSADASVGRDIRDDLFKHGLQLLAEMTGKTPDSCRSTLGKWLKLVDDEAIHVLGAIEDAHRNRVADPIAWIFEKLKPRGFSGYHRETTTDKTKRLAAKLDTALHGKARPAGSPDGSGSNVIGLPGQQLRMFGRIPGDTG